MSRDKLGLKIYGDEINAQMVSKVGRKEGRRWDTREESLTVRGSHVQIT
jgi:hypothetical protein